MFEMSSEIAKIQISEQRTKYFLFFFAFHLVYTNFAA